MTELLVVLRIILGLVQLSTLCICFLIEASPLSVWPTVGHMFVGMWDRICDPTVIANIGLHPLTLIKWSVFGDLDVSSVL